MTIALFIIAMLALSAVVAWVARSTVWNRVKGAPPEAAPSDPPKGDAHEPH